MNAIASEHDALRDGWSPLPDAWHDAAEQLGRWPSVVAYMLQRLNGRTWRWRFDGNVVQLWQHLSLRFRGWVGRDNFIVAWRALTDAGLVKQGRAGWRCVVSVAAPTLKPGSVAPKSRAAAAPDSRPTPKGTRARAPLLVVGSTDLVVLPAAPLMRCKMPNQPTRPRPGSMTPRELAQLRAEVYGEPPPPPAPAVPPPSLSWTCRFEALLDAVGKRWEGTNASTMLYLQTGLLPRLEELSNRASDGVWSEAVQVLLAKQGARPGSVARYLSGILERKLAEAEKAEKPDQPATIYDLTGRGAAQGRRPTLAGMIKTCNINTADGSTATSSTTGGQEGRPQAKGRGPHPQGRQGLSALPGAHAGDAASHHDDHGVRGVSEEPVEPHRRAAQGARPQLDLHGEAAPDHPAVHLRLPPAGSDAVEQVPPDLRHSRVGRA